MPVNSKILEGPKMFPKSTADVAFERAFESGAGTFLQGLSLEACPQEFRPVVGNSRLYDRWVLGFKSAAAADGATATCPQ